MKKLFFSLILLAAFSVFWSIGIQAAGTTSNPNQAGDVRIIDENGVIYLSTETDTNAVYTVETATLAGQQRRYNIQVPESYATNFGVLVSFVLRLVLAVAALLVFAFLILGAFDWITSGGDKGKTERARGKIVAAVIGLIIVASSYAIMNLVLSFLGFGSIEHALINIGTIERTPSPATESDLGTLIIATPSATPN